MYFFFYFLAFFLEFSSGKNDDRRLLQSYQPLYGYNFGVGNMIGVLPYSGNGIAVCYYSAQYVYLKIYSQTATVLYQKYFGGVSDSIFSEITNYGFMVAFISSNTPYFLVVDHSMQSPYSNSIT